MNIILSALMLSAVLVTNQPTQELMTQYYARNTLSEVIFGDAIADSIYKDFNLGEHSLFFSDLEKLTFQEDLKELSIDLPPDSSYLYAEKIEPSLKKLHSSINAFCKKYPSTNISSLLKAWSSFHFSKEEKETLSYFTELKKKAENKPLPPLETHLLSVLSDCAHVKASFKERAKNYPFFYLDHGNYLLELYTHKKMMKLLDHAFEPVVFHHIETYLHIAQKKASFFHNTNLLHQLIQGDLALCTEAEIAAKNLLKPQLKKINSYFEEIDAPNQRKKI